MSRDPHQISEMSSGVNPAATFSSTDEYVTVRKRRRACEACRQLKVRCDPDPTDPDDSCVRCARGKRRCTVLEVRHQNKGKENGDDESVVMQLERKIDTLTNALAARLSAPQPVGINDRGYRERTEDDISRPTTLQSQRNDYGMDCLPNIGTIGRPAETIMIPAINNPENNQTPSAAQRNQCIDADCPDIIERRIIDEHTAGKAFDRFVNDFIPIMPIIIFPPETTMESIRRSKPVLFLVIMSTTIVDFKPSVHTEVLHEVSRVFAERIVVKGQKSLELLQAIMVSCMWHTPPESFEEIKLFQLLHMVISMALDMGMGQRTRSKGGKEQTVFRTILRRRIFLSDPDSLEARRIWLSCYYLHSSISMLWRRPLMMRWDPYLDECVEMLQSSPEASPPDKLIVYYARLAHIIEDAWRQFLVEDLPEDLKLRGAQISFNLRWFQKRLNQWHGEVDPSYFSPTLKHAEYVTTIFINETVLTLDPKFLRDSCNTPDGACIDSAVSTAYANAANLYLTSIHEVLKIMNSLPLQTIMCLPIIFFTTTGHSSIGLIKLFSWSSQSTHPLRAVLSSSDLRVNEYLDMIIKHLSGLDDWPGGRAMKRFASIMIRMKQWMLGKQGRDATGSGAQTAFARPKFESRIFDILLEVATGEQQQYNIEAQQNRNLEPEREYTESNGSQIPPQNPADVQGYEGQPQFPGDLTPEGLFGLDSLIGDDCITTLMNMSGYPFGL